MNRIRGFTLLEVLLATALTALLAIAGWSWIRGAVQSGNRAQQRADHVAEALSIVRLMADDLRGVQIPSGARLDEHGFHCRTLATVPGQPDVGWRDITWKFQPSGQLVRRDGEVERIISIRFRCVFHADDHDPVLWWVHMTPVSSLSVEAQGYSEAPAWIFFLGSP